MSSYKSFIVDKGHISEPSDWRILRQLPHANVMPPLSTNVLICSVTLNLSVSRDSHSTPFANKNTLRHRHFSKQNSQIEKRSIQFPNHLNISLVLSSFYLTSIFYERRYVSFVTTEYKRRFSRREKPVDPCYLLRQLYHPVRRLRVRTALVFDAVDLLVPLNDPRYPCNRL